jgi:hypothetical protein
MLLPWNNLGLWYFIWNSDGCNPYATLRTVVTNNVLCWITTILACMLKVVWNPLRFSDYWGYGSLSTGIWLLWWLFLYLHSYNLVGSVTHTTQKIISDTPDRTPRCRGSIESSVCLEIVLIMMQDRCTVCVKCTIGSEIILDSPNGTPR